MYKFDLDEIVQRESRLILDTSSISPDRIHISDEIEWIKKWIEVLDSSKHIYVTTETLDELRGLRRGIKKGSTTVKKMMGKKLKNYSSTKEVSLNVTTKREALKSLMSRLGRHKIDLSHFKPYQQIREILCYLEDTFHIKRNVKNPNNRTDEANIALALYFSFCGSGSTGVLSRDADFQLLLRAFKDVLTKKTFRPKSKPLVRQLMENNVRLYWEQNPNSHAISFNSRTYREKEFFLEGKDIGYLRERFQSLASIFS